LIHYATDFGVEQRLTAGDTGDRGSSFINSLNALILSQHLLPGTFIFPEATTSNTGQVAT
jgi:hypothetical protein